MCQGEWTVCVPSVCVCAFLRWDTTPWLYLLGEAGKCMQGAVQSCSVPKTGTCAFLDQMGGK